MSTPKTSVKTTSCRLDTGEEISCRESFGLELLTGTGPQSVRVSLGKHSVILRRVPRGKIQMDTGRRDRDARRSTGCDDFRAAVGFAEEYLAEQQVAALSQVGVAVAEAAAAERITLNDLWLLCGRYYLPNLSTNQRRAVELAFACAIEIFGPRYPMTAIGNGFVQRFIKVRTTSELTIREGRQTLSPCSHVTALARMKDLAAAVRSLTKTDGTDFRPLLERDPFQAVDWPSGPAYEKRLREPCVEELFAWLMSPFVDPCTGMVLAAPVDVIDPSGSLRWFVATCYFTGHRRTACRNLFARDILTEEFRIREALRAAGGAARAHWASVWEKNGAIVMRPEYSKGDHHRVIPMCTGYRAEWDLYCSRHGTWAGDDALVPSPLSPKRVMSDATLCGRSWIRRGRKTNGGRYPRAVELARENLVRAGHDPDLVAPILPNEVIHGWRRAFATRLQRLGWGIKSDMDRSLDRHVDYLGGWTILGGGIREERYVSLDPEVLLAAVEGRAASEVIKLQGEKAAADQCALLARIARGRDM